MPEGEAQRLPEVLALAAERLGGTAALRLAHHYGGRIIYVPDRRRLAAGHPVVGSLGLDLALTVSDVFGRGHLQVPIGPLRMSGSTLVIPPDLEGATADVWKHARDPARPRRGHSGRDRTRLGVPRPFGRQAPPKGP